MITTPTSSRLHIVLLGERNSGKSSLMNAIAGQEVSIVSEVPGTTTDYVSKPMEIPGLGASVLVDTAGIDDKGKLGKERVESSLDALRGADIVMLVIDAGTWRIPELPLKDLKVVPVVNKCELMPKKFYEDISKAIKDKYGKEPVFVSAKQKAGIQEVLDALIAAVPEDWDARPITEGVVQNGDLVVLVMPQDAEAPKGRLILPQQQTLRELLDRNCRVVCCTTDCLDKTLSSLNEAPATIITDSQVFAQVKALTPEGTRLTSFSMLLAASKGDIEFFKESARKIDSLTSSSKVLVAEACSHVPASEDIGRVKLPAMLRSRAGEGLQVDVVSGRDFPEDLGEYDMVIHCGACMFNRRYVMSRVEQAKRQGVPMTNYGVAIAYMNKLL